MMLSAALILIILLTSGIAYPHHQQLRHYGQQDVVLVTNHNYTTKTFSTSFLIPTSSTYPSSAHHPRSPVAPTTSATPVYRGHVNNPTLTSSAVADVANVQWLPYTSPRSSSSSDTRCYLVTPPQQPVLIGQALRDITHYDTSLGACGITSDGDAQNVVALPHSIMGPKSNNNPYCNKTITITCIATGKTTSAIVVD
ncbi:uncharacterized protein PAC_01961 [Phialocephala subalpina]|uniref:Uncharacterized protein n=1 Tax=Phialocephala subalpina TaxID=576137 RepID=A0A1L7WH26_9HELO|nr:uncharacterized protein PAC_01961 [Phialocephala subalpina]